MVNNLENWARAERIAIRQEIEYLEAGGKVISPSGDNITAMKLERLKASLEHVNLALKEIEDANGS